MMHMYIHDTLIPNMLEWMSNGTTKAKLLENYGLTTLYQETLGEWLINIGFMLLTTHIHSNDSNYVVDLVEYHVNTIPQFQYILDKIGEKRNFGGWLSVRMNMWERPVICLGRYEAILNHYIFTKKMWD